MHRQLLTAVILALGTTVVSNAIPAGAHISSATGPTAYPARPANRATGSVDSAFVMSLDLPFLPCGVAGPALDAILLYATTKANATGPDWDNDRYAPCYGDLYSAAESAVNAGLSAGAGVDHTATALDPTDDKAYAWASTGPGSVTANYTYKESCPLASSTGEAIGWIRVSGPATGVYGPSVDDILASSFPGPLPTPVISADVTNKFWWSRVGLVAIVGLDDTIVNLNGAGAPPPFTSPMTVGVAAAIFIPTVQSCTPHTHPNDILIAAAGGSVGTNIL